MCLKECAQQPTRRFFLIFGSRGATDLFSFKEKRKNVDYHISYIPPSPAKGVCYYATHVFLFLFVFPEHLCANQYYNKVILKSQFGNFVYKQLGSHINR